MSDLTTGTHFDSQGSVICKLPSGAFGDPYLLKNDELNRFQILKVAKDNDPEARRLFMQEGVQMKNFPAKSFVQVYEVGGVDVDLEAGEPPYILMDYIPGVTLFDYLEALRNYPGQPYQMNPLIKFKIIYGIAFSLACLHLNGRVHRDIKPSNIFLDNQFQPHLGDFGEITEKTQTNNIHGTMNYLPPEANQPDGVAIPCGPEYDIYEFGASLFHILTYEWPYNDIGNDKRILTDYISKGILDQRFEPGQPNAHCIPVEDAELYQLAKLCMAYRREDRPTANTLIQWIADGAQKKLSPQDYAEFAKYGTNLANGKPEYYGTFANCQDAIQKGFATRSATLAAINDYFSEPSSEQKLKETYTNTTVASQRAAVQSVRAPIPGGSI